MKYISNNLEETQNIADDFVSGLKLGDVATVVGLYGNLGAGKTTFTQCLAKALGVEDTVTSPTFVIEKIYELSGHTSTNSGLEKFEHLIHIDAYRIEKSDELVKLGWREIISNPKNLILIEWPDKVDDIMPKHIKISLKSLGNEDSREIEIVV